MLSQLKNLLSPANQLYNSFHAYSFDKKICVKSSKTKFGRNHHIGLGEGEKWWPLLGCHFSLQSRAI
jgi:hypothetical protein